MTLKMHSLFHLLTFFLLTVGCGGERLKDRMYKPVSATNFCFRRTNGTDQFGCTSDLGGNVGVLHVVKTDQDMEWLLSENAQSSPYVAALDHNTFKRNNLIKLRDSGKIAGILFFAAEGRPEDGYSDDSTCPNEVSSLYAEDAQHNCNTERPWNAAGSEMMYESFNFPIFLIDNANESQKITEYYEEYNTGNPPEWPLVALELSSHMYSSVDTETCIRRSSMFSVINPQKFCDEMGDFNFFLFLKERNQTEPENPKSVILLSTQLDGMNLYDVHEFGGDKPVTNVVTLLEVARMLSQVDINFDKAENILFAFFYGEAFDYMASARYVYDMENQKFPDEIDSEKFTDGQQPLFNMSNIDFVLELGQLYNVDSNEKLFAHTDPEFKDVNLLSLLQTRASQNNIDLSTRTTKGILPPSSLHSFLKTNRNVKGIFLSDYDEKYTNNYYHSVFDTGKENLNYNYDDGEDQKIVKHIANVATTVAEFVFEQASSSAFPSFTPNATLINELLHCYLDVGNCTMFMAVSNANTPPFYAPFPSTPWPQYVGVDMKSQFHGIFTRNVLAYLTGENLDSEENHTSQEDCKAPEGQNFYEYIFLKGEAVPDWWTGDKACNETSDCGYCYKTLSFRRQSVSPAFVIDDYDFSNKTYPAWAESVWKSTSARLFLKADPSLQLVYFFVGLIVLIASFVIVYWINRYANCIFTEESPETEATAANADPTSTNADNPAHL